MSSEIIPVTPNIELRAVDERYTSELHHLVVKKQSLATNRLRLGATRRQ
ncbi:ribosomal-protein-L7/L12-serine acetyltransferase [Enterobacter cancerogenus]|uniref:Ribosomal-protein-L7/L12-serine acetyltransferase n=1 Tax=Enterobacter cancerogenus TaxID=69218 RepID=A0A484YY66_9ENTR|nr:ribosomal-protein-L7/L12-serine acetyltransferase [Enterobacter cancerogenus]